MTPPITRDGDGIFVDDDGVKRRTILAGAAWSIPVISVATAAPAFAATNDLTLEFDKSTYTGEACKTITGAKVTAKRNGVAAAGQSVTVTLADGYTFSDGSTSYTATTGSDGSITLPDVKVPAQGGNSTMSATSGSAKASASIETASTIAAYQNNGSGTNNKMSSVPTKSVAIGDLTFLADNGDLYYNNKVIATGVKSASFDFTNSNDGRINYVSSDGAYQYSTNSGDKNSFSAVPTSSKAIGDATFLADNGDLYYNNKVIATGVKSASFDFTNSNDGRINYVNGEGAYQYSTFSGDTNKMSKVPTGSKAIGDLTFLAENGDLYYNDSVIATGVKSASFDFTGSNDGRINYVTSDGAYQYSTGSGDKNKLSNVPTSSTAVGDTTFLAENGDLYYNNAVIAKKVTSASFDFTSDNSPRINYVGAPACS